MTSSILYAIIPVMREREKSPESILYQTLIPQINYKKVYKKTKTGWVYLKDCHFNTGFVKRHLNCEHILGYTMYKDVSQHVVIDIDAHNIIDKETVYERYDTIIDILGAPSFVVTSSSSGGLHLYYTFEKFYYIGGALIIIALLAVVIMKNMPDMDKIKIKMRIASIVKKKMKKQ